MSTRPSLSAHADMDRDLLGQRDGRTEILSVEVLAVDVRAADHKSGDQRHDFHAAILDQAIYDRLNLLLEYLA